MRSIISCEEELVWWLESLNFKNSYQVKESSPVPGPHNENGLWNETFMNDPQFPNLQENVIDLLHGIT